MPILVSTVSNYYLLNYLLAFRPLLLKAVNRLPRIYNTKLEFTPTLGFCLAPYFTHDASCVMLNTDWTPLGIFILAE